MYVFCVFVGTCLSWFCDECLFVAGEQPTQHRVDRVPSLESVPTGETPRDGLNANGTLKSPPVR